MSDPFKRLFVNKEKLALEVAAESQDVLRISELDCSPILPLPLKDLKEWARILLELSTAYLCYLGGKLESEYVSRDSLSKRCEIKPNALRARLSDLRKEGLLESTDEGETITVQGLFAFLQFLRDLESDLKSERGGEK